MTNKMNKKFKEAEQEVYEKIDKLRNNLSPLLKFNLEHSGGKIRMQGLVDRGWEVRFKESKPNSHIAVLTKNVMEIELGYNGTELNFFRWLQIPEKKVSEFLSVAQSDCDSAGIEESQLLREDMDYLWDCPVDVLEDLTEDERCFCKIISDVVNMKSREYGSVRRLYTPCVRAILTEDDADGRKILANITNSNLLTDSLTIVSINEWEEGAVALLAQLLMLFNEEIVEGAFAYRQWKSIFQAAVVGDCMLMAAFAAEKCAEFLPKYKGNDKKNGFTVERYRMIAACCRYEKIRAILDDGPKKSKAKRKDLFNIWHDGMKAIACSFNAQIEKFEKENPTLKHYCVGAKSPLEWQAWALMDNGHRVSRVIHNFPKPALAGDWPHRVCPNFVQKQGITTCDLLHGLVPYDSEEELIKLADRLEAECTVAQQEFSTRQDVEEVLCSTKNEFKAMEAFNPADLGKFEIEPCLICGIGEDKAGKETKTPLFIGLEREQRTKEDDEWIVKLWECNPWAIGACGEGRFELENCVDVHAVMPYYQNDCLTIDRGVKMQAYLMFLALTLSKDVPKKTYGKGKNEIRVGSNLSYLVNSSSHPAVMSEALYGLRAKVVSVREVTMRGAEGVLGFTLHFQQNVLPHDLTLYIHRSRVEGEMPKKGDVVLSFGVLCIDAVGAAEDIDEFHIRHANGLPVPRETPPGSIVMD